MKKRTITLKSRDQAEAIMHALAHVENNRRMLIARRDEEMLAITERHAPALEVLEAEAKTLRADLEAWASTHPEEYQKGTKYICLPSGDISQRTTTPSLKVLRGWNWERVLGAVMLTLPNFVRQQPEVDRAALIAQRDELVDILPLVGLKVDQREKWNIEPNLTALEP